MEPLNLKNHFFAVFPKFEKIECHDLPKLRTNFDLSFRICREKSRKSNGKKKGILLPRNYLKFPLVKVIINKIAFRRVFKLTENEMHAFAAFLSLQKLNS